MKRNYSKTIFQTALAALMMATGVFASAKTEWAAINNGNTVKHSPLPEKKSLKDAYARSKGYVSPETRIKPVLDGVRKNTARVYQRPENMLRTPQSPRGNVYGVVCRHSEMTYANQAFLGKIDLASGDMTPMYYGSVFSPYVSEDYVYQTNAYRKGMVYCPRGYYDDIETVAAWDVVDFETGEVVDVINFDDPLAIACGVTYDPFKDIFYTISIDNAAGTDGNFGVVEPNKGWKYTRLGKLETNNGEKAPFISCIVFNTKDRQVYAFDDDNYVYTIHVSEDYADTLDTYLVEAGEMDNILLFPQQYGEVGQICYSPMDDSFVAIYRNNQMQANQLIYVHPETFEQYIGQTVTCEVVPYIGSLFCTDDFATADAPELAPAPVISFDKASLTGSMTFTAPSLTYVGIEIGNTPLRAVVKIDGEVFYDKNIKAGESFTINPTLSQANHVIEFTTAIGDNVSPIRSVEYFVGNDNPKAPTKLNLDLTHLSWTAPGAVGAHKGYVDVADLTYDIYLDDAKQNSAPVKACEFDLAVPEDMRLYNVKVVAVAHGQESEPATIREILGEAFDLPFTTTPVKGAESDVFTIINANHDGRVWYPSTRLADQHDGFTFQCGYVDDADDWLILPAINFTDANVLYNVEFDIEGIYTDLQTLESFDIYVGKKPTVEAMKAGSCIYSDIRFQALAGNPARISANFGIPAPGNYYVAIHERSTREQSSQGVFVTNFEVKALSGQSSAVPGDPSDVKITSGEFGTTEALITAKLPTMDILGNPLPADQDITLHVECNNLTNTTVGKPGQTVSVGHDAGADGYAYFSVMPSNESGNGYKRTYKVYCGIDTPLCPTNITGVPTSDNLKLNLTWDAPGNVGQHGGYVDVSELTYNIYTKSGISLYKVGNVKDLHCTFEPFTGDYTTLSTFLVGPSAINDAGESINSIFVQEDLGTPYEVPMKEEWGTQAFNYMPYNFMTTGTYAASTWGNVGTAAGLGIGDPTLVNGGVLSYATGGMPCDSKIILPKATTLGVSKADFILRFWDYAEAPKSIQVYGRRDGNPDEVLIGEYKLRRPSRGEWREEKIALPAEFCDCSWIQIRVATHFTAQAQAEYLLLDSFQIFPDVDYDLKLTSLSGPSQVSVGDHITYKASVANGGHERARGGKFRFEFVDKDNKTIAYSESNISDLTSNQVWEYEGEFDIDGSFRDLGELTARATIVYAEDENTSNNSKKINVKVMTAPIPVINDLAGERLPGENVALSWSAPVATYGNFDNFEYVPAFQVTDHIGMWQNIDLDGLTPMGIVNQATGNALEWGENTYMPQAWTVMNADILGHPSDRIEPHSGKQCLIARPGQYDEEAHPKGIQSSKWLISPEIVSGTDISFWFSTLDSSVKEYVELWYCTEDTPALDPKGTIINNTRCGNFRRARSFDKGGEQTWEFCTWSPKSTPEMKAKYYALRFCSFNSYMAAIDDITITPANMLERSADSYSVYRSIDNGEFELIADKITTPSFTDTTRGDIDARYYVVANCLIDGEVISGPKSNVILVGSSSVNEILADGIVRAGKGQISIFNNAAAAFSIASLDGKVVKRGQILTNQDVYAVDKGIYLVTVGKKTVKVVVK